MEVEILFHNGVERLDLDEIHEIIEKDNGQDLRVFFSDDLGDYVDYHAASMTALRPNSE